MVVVGAGLAGCSTARFLAEAGARVTLIDPGGVGAGASGRNGGFLFPQPAPWINDLLGESLEIYRELEAEGSVPGLDSQEAVDLLSAADVPVFATGFFVSFVSALIVVKLFVSFVSRSTFVPFAVYRIVFGIALLLWYRQRPW